MNTRDEIMYKFASAGITKTAADLVDVAQSLGIDAAIGGGVGGGIAALTGGALGEGVLAGIGIPAALIAGTATLPVSAVVALAVLAGSTGYTIYEALKHTDDNLDDLVDRLDALDPNDKIKPKLDQYLAYFKGLQEQDALEAKQESDVASKTTDLGQKIQNLTAFLRQLHALDKDWLEIKTNLTDWGFDPDQAETAIKRTLAATEQSMAQIKAKATNEALKMMEQRAKSKAAYIGTDEIMVRFAEGLDKTAAWPFEAFFRGISESLSPTAVKAIGLVRVAIERVSSGFEDKATATGKDWVSNLKKAEEALSEKEDITEEPRVKAVYCYKMHNTATQTLELLKTIQRLWTNPNYADQFGKTGLNLGMRLGDVDSALDHAIEQLSSFVEKTGETLRTQMGSYLEHLKTETKVDLIGLSSEILDLQAQIETIYGAGKVKYTSDEQQLLTFTKAITEQKYDLDQIAQYANALTSFRDMLQAAITEAPKHTKKTHSSIRNISKRALTLPDGAVIKPKQVSTTQEHPEPYREPNPVAQVIGLIQQSINAINLHETGGQQINPDKVYGPITAGALCELRSKNKDVAAKLNIPDDQLKNVETMNANPQAYVQIAQILVPIARQLMGMPTASTSTPASVAGIDGDKQIRELNDAQLLAVLHNNTVQDEGQNINAYEYLKARGRSEKQMADLLKTLFYNTQIGKLNMSQLVNEVKSNPQNALWTGAPQ